jgi:3-oxoacyl-ACP reductase-like protein
MNVKTFQSRLAQLANLSGLELSYKAGSQAVQAYEHGTRRTEAVTLFALNGHGEMESVASGSMSRVAETVESLIRILQIREEIKR